LIPSEPVFTEPWEAQAFAMAVKLHEAGLFTWKEWSDTLAAEIEKGPGDYYEHWLKALETLVERLELISREEREARIEEWDHAARSTPHGEPIELSRARPSLEMSRAASRKAPEEHR
jgi:nitrile hydratase accessory protein